MGSSVVWVKFTRGPILLQKASASDSKSFMQEMKRLEVQKARKQKARERAEQKGLHSQTVQDEEECPSLTRL